MLETFFLLYGIVIVAGSWLMLNGVTNAPIGYEDEEGFHYAAPRPVADEKFDADA